MVKIDHSIYSRRFFHHKKTWWHSFDGQKNYATPSFNIPFWSRWHSWLKWLLLTLLAILLLYLLFSLIAPLFAKETYRAIVDENAYQQIKDKRNIEITPIADGLYEAVGTNSQIVEVAQIIERTIPVNPPINLANCDPNLQFWHLDSLGYNQFVVDYINNSLTWEVVIGVLDTGIDNDHKFLGNSIMDPVLVSQGLYTGDIHGHGTHIAGIIKQINNRSSILPIKVSDWSSNEVSNIDFIKWLALVSSYTWIDVLNLSLWWYEFHEEELNLINKIVGDGVIIIASAGNEGLDTAYTFPAWHKQVISVWSNDLSSRASAFSNYDPNVRAPWECIYSTLPNNNWWFADGTSMAAPILAWYMSLNILNWIPSNDLMNTYEQNNIVLQQESVDSLLWIEEGNVTFLSSVDSIIIIVDLLKKNLADLKLDLNNSSINRAGIQRNYNEFKSLIKSETSKITRESQKIKSLYASMGMTWWTSNMVMDASTSLADNATNILNFESIVLPVNELWELVSSLWLGTCREKESFQDRHACWSACNEIWSLICWIFDPIIPKWSSLPYESESSYFTIIDYQETMNLSVYQWDARFASDNNELWNVEIKNLPSRIAGETKVNVTFSVDKNWVLSVKAIDDSNKNNYNTAIIRQGIDYNIAQDSSNSNIEDILNALSDIEDQLNSFNTYINSLKVYRPNDSVSINIPKASINEVNATDKSYIVSRVIDWDTLDVKDNDGNIKRVRLIWIDAPEYNSTRNTAECYGKEAAEFLQTKIHDKLIYLEHDESQGRYDKYWRELAYVFLWTENINNNLIDMWYAREYTYNKPYKYNQMFLDSEAQAKISYLWLWSVCN